MVGVGEGERREVGGSMKGVPAAEDASLPWGSGSGNKEEKKDLKVKKKKVKMHCSDYMHQS